MTGTAAAEVVSVKRAEREMECRRCPRPIRPGQRAVLVLGTGQVHLRCLLGGQAGDDGTGREPAS